MRVGLRLGLGLCVPHQRLCGSLVSSTGVHSFVCKKAPGRTARHHALNDLIARTLVSAGIPVTKEPNGLSRSDGKRPEGLNLVPWNEGKPLPWDTTVVCTVQTLAVYVSGSARGGTAAKTAAQRKETKYATLLGTYLSQTVVIESLGTGRSDFVISGRAGSQDLSIVWRQS